MMDVGGVSVSLPALVALGLLIGLISGTFGVGGGFLLTPLLTVLFGIPIEIAVGSGLCQMVGSTTAAFLKHRQLGQGETRFAILMVPGSLLGVTLGAHVVELLSRMGAREVLGKPQPIGTLILFSIYVVFLLLVASVMWRQGRGSHERLDYVRRGPLARIALGPLIDLPAVPLPRVSAIIIAYVGLGLGFLSGLLGIGGGIVLIPIMLYGYGFPFRQSAGTGVLVTLLTAAVGTLAHARSGNVDLALALVLLVGSSLSAQFGAIAAYRFSARRLRRVLALIVLVTAGIIVWHLLGELLW